MKPLFACLALWGTSASLAAALPLSGTYDEQTVQSNQVDRALTSLTHVMFQERLNTAHPAGFGGVVDFDLGEPLLNQATLMIAFPGGAKQLRIEGSTAAGANDFDINHPGPTTRIPVSGSQGLETNGGDVVLRFADLQGGAPDEAVLSAGITVLGRDPSTTLTRSFSAFAGLSDGTTTAPVSGNHAGILTGDTFVGFEAPVGVALTSLHLRFESGSFTTLDDLVVITGVPQVIEPDPLGPPPAPVRASPAGAPIGAAAPTPDASFAAWAVSHGLVGSASDPGADPDDDSLTNLLEYAFLLDPMVAATPQVDPQRWYGPRAQGLPRIDTAAAALQVTFVRRRDDPALRYALEVSTDMQTWAAFDLETAKVSLLSGSRHVDLVRVAVPVEDAVTRFARVRVSLGAVAGTLYQIANQADFDRLSTTTFAPGDRILFQRGRVFSGMFAPLGSGLPAAPIRVGTYGTGRMPIINALGANPAGFFLKNGECWEITGLEITNTNGTEADQGQLSGIQVVYDDNAGGPVRRHLRIEGNYIHHVNGMVEGKGRGGIQIQVSNAAGAAPFRLDDVRVVGNTIEEVGGTGIENRSSYVGVEAGLTEQLWTNVYVAHNYINRTGRNCIIARASRDAVYEYNVLANSSRASTGHSIYNFSTIGIRMQHNEAYGNVGTGGIDRGGFDADWDSEGTVIQHNYSHDNHWFCGIMRRYNKGARIRYNISQNERQALYYYGFHEAVAEDIVVHNNTHFVAASVGRIPVIYPDSPALNTTFANNIFYFELGGTWNLMIANAVNTTVTHNLYVNLSRTFYGRTDPGGVVANPQFVSPGSGGTDIDMTDPDRLAGYRLQASSPAMDAGMIIPGASGVRDFWNNPVPAGSAPDIGAHEFQP